jgi:hypothetical protein
MTHSELLRSRARPGWLEPSDCPGELAEVGTYPDRVLDPETGRTRELVVTVHVCKAPGCGARIVEAEGRIRNAYAWDLPADAVLGLAAEAAPKRRREPPRRRGRDRPPSP